MNNEHSAVMNHGHRLTTKSAMFKKSVQPSESYSDYEASIRCAK